jgi:hyaluronoglucosaminidase
MFSWRGVVEGFYGPPWPQVDRLWMLERLGRWGMNLYVYAPKNDPLHRERWREPYGEAARAEFSELIEQGERNGVQVGFALSPGLSIRYSSSADLRAFVEKVRGFVSLGSRFISLALDDVPFALAHPEDARAFGTLGAAHVAFAHAVREALGPDVVLWLVPTDYLGVEPSEYLETLRGLDAAIEVGWTGRTVCSPSIEAGEARRRAETLGRKLLLWDNVPVSDGPMRSMLHLGPYGRRAPELAESLSGVLLNPMQHARASGVALRTAAAWLADPAGYDAERAWDEALRELGDGAPAAFRLFAEAHRFSPIWSDSRDRELEVALDELRAARGDDAAIRATLERLSAALEARAPVGDALREGLVDRRLAAELEPWLDSHGLETARLRASVAALAALVDPERTPLSRIMALFGLEIALRQPTPSEAVSYGPRRVLYPQLVSMQDGEARFGADPALVRDCNLADAFARFVEDLALERLG